MNVLEIGPVFSVFSSGDREIIRKISVIPRLRVDGYQYSDAYKNGRWDGWISLGRYSKGKFLFPTGVAPHVLEVLRKDGVEVDIVSSRRRPDPMANRLVGGLDGIVLRDYQEEMISTITSPFCIGSDLYELTDEDSEFLSTGIGVQTPYRLPGIGIWSSATGSGKTLASAGLIASLAVSTLFVVYGNTLVEQTWDVFNLRLGRWLSNNGLELGIGVEGSVRKGFVTVAGSSTLIAILDRPEALKKSLLKRTNKFFAASKENRFKIGEIRKWGKSLLSSSSLESEDSFSGMLDRYHEIDPGGIVSGPLSREMDYLKSFYGKMEKARQSREDLTNWLNDVQLLILDECHGAAADGVYDLLQYCPAYYRVAMSATPLGRSDGRNLKAIAAFGDPVVKLTNADMREAGVIPPARIIFSKIGGRVSMFRGYRWPDLYTSGIVNYAPRNYKIIRHIQEHYEAGKKILVIFKAHEHGELLSNLLWCQLDSEDEHTFIPHEVLHDEPIPHEKVDGRDPQARRRDVLSKFRDGIIRVLIASEIFGTGLDLPEVQVLVNAAGGKSVIPVKQRLGRSLRGKDKVIVRDYADTQHRTLAKHALNRLKIYNGEGCFEVVEGD